nr:AF211539_1 Avr9/Cf-9 rapidly elicited protein 65 [Ipomoea batatas]
MMSLFSSFEVLCADSFGVKLQQTGSESKTAPPPSAAAGGSNKSGEVPTPQAKRPQQQRRPRFAPEFDGVHCFETVIPY